MGAEQKRRKNSRFKSLASIMMNVIWSAITKSLCPLLHNNCPHAYVPHCALSPPAVGWKGRFSNSKYSKSASRRAFEDLAEVVAPQENIQQVPSLLLLSITLSVHMKILEIFGKLLVTKQNGKASYFSECWISHDAVRKRF